PGFAKALARTLMELRLAGVAAGQLNGLSRRSGDPTNMKLDLSESPRSGPDLAELMNRVELLMNDAGASDRAALFETATTALGSAEAGWPRMPVLLLDVPFDSEGESRFLLALADQATAALITIPSGDARTIARLGACRLAIELLE